MPQKAWRQKCPLVSGALDEFTIKHLAPSNGACARPSRLHASEQTASS